MGALASSRTATAALAVLSAPLALLAAAAFVPQAGELRHVLNVGVYDNVVLGAGAACALRARRVSRDRLAWLALGAALLAWGAGDTYWTFWVAGRPSAPSPSFADLGYLAVYPLAYVALVLLLRARVPRLHPSLWLDGVLGALAVAAAGAAIVFPVVQRTLGGPPAVVATNLAYPLADLTLVGLVVWGLCVLGWRIDREWALIAAGLVVFSLSDFLYLWQTAVGSYEDGSPTDLGWVAGALLLAWAAWQPRRRDERAAARLPGRARRHGDPAARADRVRLRRVRRDDLDAAVRAGAHGRRGARGAPSRRRDPVRPGRGRGGPSARRLRGGRRAGRRERPGAGRGRLGSPPARFTGRKHGENGPIADGQ